MTVMNIVEAVNKALEQEMKKDPDVIVLGEDVGKDGGVFRVTEHLLEEFGPDRVIDTPLSEAGIVGAAIGMAVYGLKPVAEVQFSGFLYMAFDELISHAARIRTRSRGRYHCPLVVRAPYSGGIHAPEHHSESMEAVYGHTPGLKIVIPSNPYDAKGLLISAIRDPDPVVFLEPKKVYRAIKQEVPDEEFIVPLSKANVIKEGDDLTIVSWGAMMKPTLEAAEKLDKEYSLEIIDLRTIFPMDRKTIIDSVKKTGKVVIVHEAPRSGGWGAEITAVINEKALTSLEAPVERVTGFDTVFPLYKLESYYLPDAGRIIRAVKKVMNY